METQPPGTGDGELIADTGPSEYDSEEASTDDGNHETVAPEAVDQQLTSSDGINRYPDRWGHWPDHM